MRVAVLEQETKDKEQVLAKSSDLLGAEQDKKVSLRIFFHMGESFQDYT